MWRKPESGLFLVGVVFLTSCYPSKPRKAFESYQIPAPPNYSSLDYWAAHPEKLDSADRIPDSSMINGQEDAAADVFFLHPTTYVGSVGENQWNAPVDDIHLNNQTDDISIKNQASVFNACYRIYAPRYRQAHYESYFTDHQADARKAFHLAYSDVRAAFEYYLEHENNGRPFVIAGHSQGSTHAIQLLKDYIDGRPLSNQLVAAYIPGMLVTQQEFSSLQPCDQPESVGCICAWRTVKTGFEPRKKQLYLADSMIITNPLSWTTTDTLVHAEDNPGSVLLDFYNGLVPNVAGAKIEDGFIRTDKPSFRGSFFIWTQNYHQGDINLYYQSIRMNACRRLEAFMDNPTADKQKSDARK